MVYLQAVLLRYQATPEINFMQNELALNEENRLLK
jgi:hypothetical protein